VFISSKVLLVYGVLISSIFGSTTALAANCPVLPNVSHYQQTQQWLELLEQWLPQQSNCLRSSRYFSLIGAAQLNLGQLSTAQLSLERALLLDADNGSAMLDYSQVLFNQGQLFAAIDLNQQLQRRADLPSYLSALLQERATAWQSLTRRHSTELAISGGYNSNLNNAPDLQTLEVTIDGQPGHLTLSERSQEIGGAQSNIILTQRYDWSSAERQQQLSLTLDGRRSHDTDSDLQRVTAQYISRSQQYNGTIEWDGRVNYVHFGGKALYSDSEIGSRFDWNGDGNHSCRPLLKGRLTYRHFYQDDNSDGAILALGGGFNCNLGNGLLSMSLEQVENIAIRERAGDDRRGPRLELQWQQPLLRGQFSSALQLSYNQDSAGYSTLLNNNEKRHILFSKLQFNYRQPIHKDLAWTLAASVGEQRSNLELFEQQSRRLDLGLEWRF